MLRGLTRRRFVSCLSLCIHVLWGRGGGGGDNSGFASEGSGGEGRGMGVGGLDFCVRGIQTQGYNAGESHIPHSCGKC